MLHNPVTLASAAAKGGVKFLHPCGSRRLHWCGSFRDALTGGCTESPPCKDFTWSRERGAASTSFHLSLPVGHVFRVKYELTTNRSQPRASVSLRGRERVGHDGGAGLVKTPHFYNGRQLGLKRASTIGGRVSRRPRTGEGVDKGQRRRQNTTRSTKLSRVASHQPLDTISRASYSRCTNSWRTPNPRPPGRRVYFPSESLQTLVGSSVSTNPYFKSSSTFSRRWQVAPRVLWHLPDVFN